MSIETTPIKLERPHLGKIAGVIADISIYAFSMATVINYSDGFTLSLPIFQKFLTFLIVNGILVILSTYHMLFILYNRNRVFSTYLELLDWRSKYMFPYMELIITMISLIIRFSFMDSIWIMPQGLNSQQKEVFLAVYIVSLFTLIYFGLTGIVSIICICLLLYVRMGQNITVMRRIVRVNAVTPVFHFVTVENKPDYDCVICLDNPARETWIQLGCGHKYHQGCFTKYISSSYSMPRCAICRGNISQVMPSIV